MENINNDIKNSLINNNNNRYGIYNILIKTYLPFISQLIDSGYKVKKIIYKIENELQIEHGTIQYRAFHKALSKTELIKKTSTKIKDKKSQQIKKLDPEQILELDKINLNITGLEKKRKNIFDDDDD